MAIMTLKEDETLLNDAIHATCNMVYDIEDLLSRGPKQLDAYSALLLILKDLKRGISIKESTEIRGTQLCPPGLSSSDKCNGLSCQMCWQEYVKSYIDRIQERKNKK